MFLTLFGADASGRLPAVWTVVAAWRVVVKRAAADRLMLTAAAITVVLATTLLAAGPIYSDAVTLSALR